MSLVPEKANPDYNYKDGEYAYVINTFGDPHSDCHNASAISEDGFLKCPVCKAILMWG